MRVVLCFLFFSFWPPKWSWRSSHIPLSVTPSPFCAQWVTPGGFYPQFLYASANICTHIHAHIPGPMPTSHALPRLNTARGPTLCSTSYPFPAQEGISQQKHSESARMNLPHPPPKPLYNFSVAPTFPDNVHVSQISPYLSSASNT